jgi:hypothetical protein
MATSEFIDHHLADVMTGGSVFFPWITKAHYQPRHNNKA